MTASALRRRWTALSQGQRLAYVVMSGVLAAVAVGYLTTQDRSAWLLDRSSGRVAFSIGVLISGLMPTLLCYVMLAHPRGRLRSDGDRTLLLIAGALLLVAWSVTVLASSQPPDHTPLLRCSPDCPGNAFLLWKLPDVVSDLLQLLAVAAWLTLTWGTTVLLYRRAAAAPRPIRRSLGPVEFAGAAQALLLTAFVIAEIAAPDASSVLGAAYIDLVIALPLAIVLGLALERLSMGRALAAVVHKLARTTADPQSVISDALGDPSLSIVYPRGNVSECVDRHGRPVAMPPTEDRAVTWIGDDNHPVAAVVYDAELSDQDRFVAAIGVAALMRLENARLEAELRASTTDLMASRIRLVESAHAERRRIERDLHDGVQQRLIVMRVKLETAAELLDQDPDRSRQMLAAIERHMDETLEELRALARGIYPALLGEHGIAEALTSAGRRAATPVTVRAPGIARYPEEIEVAVYFCCLEALQNAAKHAGPDAVVVIRVWEQGDSLRFEVRDRGIGFAIDSRTTGSGLINMRDRIEAVGGRLRITSAPGAGTSVAGAVPLAARRAAPPHP